MNPRRILGGTVAALVAFTLLRSAHVFGGLADTVLVVLSAVVLLVALRLGMSRAQLGLERDALGRGARFGGTAFLAVLLVVVVAAIIPSTSAFMHDDRVQVGVGGLLRELVLSILIGTVIPEELLFRGVILGSAVEQWGRRGGIVVSSALFATWHIAPTLATAGGNAEVAEAASSLSGRAVLVAGAMVSTFIAGLVFAWLRLRSRSLLAPVIAHLSTNGVAFTVAWFVAR